MVQHVEKLENELGANRNDGSDLHMTEDAAGEECV